tara:strand:+ start:16449 stop:17705 length:1257 start_codon:yes stop_codon:yes gene_type:complete
MYALIDCNNFYVSCERVFRPDLRQQPIVVLSNNDGCVISRSEEAKAAGIPMGAPAFKFNPLFKSQGIQTFSSNYALYHDMSSRVMKILSTFSPDIEVYSIDEAFVLFSGFDNFNLKVIGKKMKQQVWQSTNIPISIGIAPTKALAKVANRIAKKFPQETESVHLIDTDEKRIKALKWIQTEDIWGIGRRHAVRLNRMGIKNAFHFTQLSDEWVRKNMAVTGLQLKQELEGLSRLKLEKNRIKRNIATTRTFEINLKDYKKVKERISTFSSVCAEKLRKQDAYCMGIIVFLYTNRHRKDLNQSRKKVFIQLPFSTNSTIELSKFATKALQLIWVQGYAYKRAGVILTDITPANEQQTTLFENSDPRHHKLMHTIDHLNKKIGQSKIKLASQDVKHTWQMKQEKLSQRYTTNWNELLKVK